MRSARMILATAAASAALAIGAPGAYAAGGDWDHDDSSYSKEHGKDYGKEKDQSEEHGKDWGKEHDAPHGGIHTGGGALTAVDDSDWATAKDPKYDPETYKDKDSEHGKDSSWSGDKEKDSSWGDKEKDSSWGDEEKGSSWGDHEKPSGGMHTGGGALATPTATAGGLAVLAVAASGLYTARRRKSAGNAA